MKGLISTHIQLFKIYLAELVHRACAVKVAIELCKTITTVLFRSSNFSFFSPINEKRLNVWTHLLPMTDENASQRDKLHHDMAVVLPLMIWWYKQSSFNCKVNTSGRFYIKLMKYSYIQLDNVFSKGIQIKDEYDVAQQRPTGVIEFSRMSHVFKLKDQSPSSMFPASPPPPTPKLRLGIIQVCQLYPVNCFRRDSQVL